MHGNRVTGKQTDRATDRRDGWMDVESFLSNRNGGITTMLSFCRIFYSLPISIIFSSHPQYVYGVLAGYIDCGWMDWCHRCVDVVFVVESWLELNPSGRRPKLIRRWNNKTNLNASPPPLLGCPSACRSATSQHSIQYCPIPRTHHFNQLINSRHLQKANRSQYYSHGD